MPQRFSPTANTIMRGSLAASAGLIALAFWVGIAISGSPYNTRQYEPREQPVPFSHEHHVAGLGIDCRYCHTTVEYSKYATIPPTKVCMNCHSELWTSADLLEPVRTSWNTGQSIRWTRVHDLPDYVYFNHSIHVQKGFGCVQCHGRVDQMPIMWQAAPLTMQWCLDCHRHPEEHIMPKDQVFNMAWSAPPDRDQEGKKLVAQYGVRSLTSCSTCHR